MYTVESKSTLARLLATENIEIRHGNYHTAWFDVQERVLGLPMWKDKGKSVYDLLVGHEVGHALFTPTEGWHESVIELGVPRSYVNVIEDIRIERMIQAKYPGLVNSFVRGYKTLFDDNLFETEGDDISEYDLIDRINLKAKVGAHLDIQFADDEMEIVKAAFEVVTFDDVIKVCQMLMKKKEEEQNEPENETEQSAGTGSGMDSEQSSGEQTQESGEQNSDSNSDVSDRQESEESGQEDEEVESNQAGSSADEPESATDKAFRKNEESLLEDSKITEMTYRFPHDKIMRTSIHDLEHIMKGEGNYKPVSPEAIVNYSSYDDWEGVKVGQMFTEFMKEQKPVLNLMMKEFEMRKAADQYSRAKTSKTGAIDPTKMYSYKYNEDIFRTVTTLADAKSHGMVMFVDWSGSMHRHIQRVAEQTILLALFCKKVNIPFEVYGFTSDGRGSTLPLGHSVINTAETKVFEILSSKMKKAKFAEAVKYLYCICHAKTFYANWSMGSTPLVETLGISYGILSRFKTKNNVQKVSAIYLTDGEPSMFDTMHESSVGADNLRKRTLSGMEQRNLPKYVIAPSGRQVHLGGRIGATTELLKDLRKEGYSVLGFFITHNPRDVRDWIRYRKREVLNHIEIEELSKKFSKEGCVTIKECGYEEAYVINTRKMKAKDDEFEVAEDAKKASITRAFKKFANSKKSNRIIMSEFAKKVA